MPQKNNLFDDFNVKNLDSKNFALKQKSLEINVLDSTFVKSIENISQAPDIIYSEIAILGRSNVGKSTLINKLLNNKNLAKSSSTPGKTRLINFFISTWRLDNIKYDLRFIDFPGFGYAKVSKSQKESWDKNLSDFLKKRDSVKLFIHLIDSRHINLKIDDEIKYFLNSILRNDCTILEVFTKCDKLNKNEFKNLKKNHKVSANDKNSIQSLRSSILNKLYGI